MYQCDACGEKLHPSDTLKCKGCNMVGICTNCQLSGKLCRSECSDNKCPGCEAATLRADQNEAKLIMLRELVIKWDPELAAVIGLTR